MGAIAMLACLDVHYSGDKATAAAVVLEDWGADAILSRYAATVGEVNAYEPGRFFVRELGPLLSVIERISEQVDILVIDAYCYLSQDFDPGLGAHLHTALDERLTIVGVAKSRYRDTNHAVELLRGGSVRPLFITSIGMDPSTAAAHVASMAGEARIPRMIKTVDRLARDSSIMDNSATQKIDGPSGTVL